MVSPCVDTTMLRGSGQLAKVQILASAESLQVSVATDVEFTFTILDDDLRQSPDWAYSVDQFFFGEFCHLGVLQAFANEKVFGGDAVRAVFHGVDSVMAEHG